MEEEQPLSRQAAFLKAHALWLQAATTAAMEYMQTHPGTRWEAAMKAVAADLWPEPLYEDYVKPKGSTKPPIRPAHIADKPTGGWSSWIGLGIVGAALVCIAVFAVLGSIGQKGSQVDSSPLPTIPVARVEDPPLQTPTPIVPDSPAKPKTVRPKETNEQTESPSTANRYRFGKPSKPFVYPPSRNEIDDVIKSGKYSALPPAEMVSPATGSGPSHLSIENQTGYTLTITFYTASQRSVTVEAGRTLEVDVEPGAYRELCRADSLTVLPFVGNDNYAAGAGYKSTYYIKHRVVP